MTNPFFVAFSSSTLRPLAAPTQSLQEAPDVTRAVSPAEPLFNHCSYPLQGPQRRGVTEDLWTANQNLLQTPHLSFRQPRTSPTEARSHQAGRSRRLEGTRPSANRLPRYPKLPCDSRLRNPFFQQPSCLNPPALKLIEIPSNTLRIPHNPNIGPSGQSVTIFLEAQ